MFTQITGYTLLEVQGKNARILNAGFKPLKYYVKFMAYKVKGRYLERRIWKQEKKWRIIL